MHLQQLPAIRFFKNDQNKISLSEFESELYTFVQATFGPFQKHTTHGSTGYSPPEKDNQFHESYIRAVYHQLDLESGQQFTFHYYSEECDNANFDKIWIYNFYNFTINFKTKTDWATYKKTWLLFKSFCLKVGFRDATLSFTYLNENLYDYYNQEQDADALKDIIQLTSEEIIQSFNTTTPFYIEIQCKPYLNIGELLSKHPNKKAVTHLQINANNLKEFPQELFEFKNLEYLQIYNNQITTAPEDLQKLPNLLNINIHSNPIKDNPIEMEKLKKLLPVDCHLVCF